MTLDELAERLSLLEGSAADQAAANEQSAFIDKYGTKFNGNEGIGMAILAEMNRRGVQSAAVGADRVVQEILDQIRMEATAILDAIKGEQAAVADLMDQVQSVQESVAAATGSPSGDGALDNPPDIPQVDAALAPAPSPVEGLPPEGEIPSDAPPVEGAPALDAPPPTEMPGEPAPAPLPPEALPSDRRVKHFVRRGPTANTGPQGRQGTWKPSASLLGAIKGGM